MSDQEFNFFKDKVIGIDGSENGNASYTKMLLEDENEHFLMGLGLDSSEYQGDIAYPKQNIRHIQSDSTIKETLQSLGTVSSRFTDDEFKTIENRLLAAQARTSEKGAKKSKITVAHANMSISEMKRQAATDKGV
jgi:hypothetical protein